MTRDKSPLSNSTSVGISENPLTHGFTTYCSSRWHSAVSLTDEAPLDITRRKPGCHTPLAKGDHSRQIFLQRILCTLHALCLEWQKDLCQALQPAPAPRQKGELVCTLLRAARKQQSVNITASSPDLLEKGGCFLLTRASLRSSLEVAVAPHLSPAQCL